MDSYVDPADWRRKSYETCFEARTPKFYFKSICLACARHCLSSLRLRPYIRFRSKGNTRCDCKASGLCVCYWSTIRARFDSFASQNDGCVGPNQLRELLIALRAPAPVEMEDVEECFVVLGDGSDETQTLPRIKAVSFEVWYRKYFDEFEGAES